MARVVVDVLKPEISDPNALGGALDEETVAVLPARIVCGGANNQLATPDMGDRLVEPASCARRTTW